MLSFISIWELCTTKFSLGDTNYLLVLHTFKTNNPSQQQNSFFFPVSGKIKLVLIVGFKNKYIITYTQKQTYTHPHVECVCNSGTILWNSGKEGKEKR
jgi:hypothetical protein